MRRLLVCALIIALSGCSSFKTVKLDSAGSIQAKDGVPMMLPKPEFAVKKVDGSDDQYQVSVGYVPDPKQRYAVRLSSTPLAQIDLSLALSETGSLTSTSGEVKDQIAPTALALFKVAASAATMIGTGGAFSLQESTALDECFVPLDLPSVAYRSQCAIKFQGSQSGSKCKTVGPDIRSRLQFYIGDKNSDKDGAAASLFARNDAEGACFAEVSTEIGKLLKITTIDPATFSTDFDTRFDIHNAAGGTDPVTDAPAKAAISKAIKDAMASGDGAMLKRIYFSADEADMDGRFKRFRKLVDDGGTSVRASDGNRTAAALADLQLQPGVPAVDGYNRVAMIGAMLDVQKAFDAVAQQTPANWKARYTTALQKTLPGLEKARVSATLASDAPAIATASKAIADTKTDIATLAGVSVEYVRLKGLQALLDKMPADSTGERISPAAEYGQISKEVAALDTLVNTAIATTMAGDTKAKAPPVLPLRTPWVSMSCITASKGKEERWRYTIGADSPEFVVVLRRADGTTLEPVAEEVATCGA